MGYDMYLIDPDPEAQAATEQAGRAYRAAATARDAFERGTSEYDAAQAAMETAYAAMSRADANYFHLNTVGMARMREDMARLNMLHTDYTDDGPPWPDPDLAAAAAGIGTDNLWELEEDEWLSHPHAAVREFGERWRRKLAWSPPGCKGIPAHKLGSNDGWIVTPIDIHQALTTYRRQSPLVVEAIRTEWRREDGSSYFDEWVAFLERAGKGAGFRVY